MSTRPRSIPALALLGAIAVAGVGYAAVPPDGVIHADSQSKRRRRGRTATAVRICLAAVGATVGLAGTAAADGPIGRPLTTTFGGARPTAGDRTVPTFTDSFTFDGVTYPYTMVGTNPHTSTATTTVPVQIVPLRIVFPDGTVLDGTPRIPGLIASPLFQPADFISGHTQYGDAIQRAQFWSTVSANGGGYHALLGQPTVLPTETLHVPKGSAVTGTANGVAYGLVDYQWFFGETMRLLGQMHVDPTTLPIFFSDGVYQYWGGDLDNCCVIGTHGTRSYDVGAGHGKGKQPIISAMWASWDHPEHFGSGGIHPGDRAIGGDVVALSHEVAEWFSDPFINNYVPYWSSPMAPWLGCVNWLEVGDAVTSEFTVNGYHLQDEVFKSWFAHDIPSEGINGQYTFRDTFTEPSTLC
jgi:hypothetical protein